MSGVRRWLRAVAGVAIAAALAAPAVAGGLPEPRPGDPEETRPAPPPEPSPEAPEPSPEAPPASATPAPTRAAPVDPAARLPDGDAAAEHWDLAAHFAAGHRLYARVVITNAGPGDRSAAAFGHWIEPDGQVHEFRNGRRAGDWELSRDRRRIRIGSSTLAFAPGARHFEVDNDKRGIEIRLEFPDDASGSPGVARGGYRVDLLNLATPAQARFRFGSDASGPLQPVEGRVLLTHTAFPGPEARHVLRRIDVATLSPGPRLFVTEIRPPEGTPWSWVVAGDDEGVAPVAGIARAAADASTGPRVPHPVPQGMDVSGDHITGGLRLGPIRFETDPLAALPALVRMVYSFGNRPRHLWVDSTADVVLKSPTRNAALRFEGPAIAALFFLDAFPPNER